MVYEYGTVFFVGAWQQPLGSISNLIHLGVDLVDVPPAHRLRSPGRPIFRTIPCRNWH